MHTLTVSLTRIVPLTVVALFMVVGGCDSNSRSSPESTPLPLSAPFAPGTKGRDLVGRPDTSAFDVTYKWSDEVTRKNAVFVWRQADGICDGIFSALACSH